MRLAIQKNSLFHVLLVHLPFVGLILMYQVNWIYKGTLIPRLIYIIIFVLASLFLLVKIKKKTEIVSFFVIYFFVLTFHLVLLKSPVKAFSGSFLLIYGFALVFYSDKSFNLILRWVFLINFVIVILQLLGVSSIFYSYQHYSPHASFFRSFLRGDTGHIPLHQYRPSGIFPSTIYLSIFQCLVYGQMVASQHYGKKLMYSLTGFLFALIGSTLSLTLFLLSVPFIFLNKKVIYFQVGYVLGFTVVCVFFNPVFVLNYTIDSIILSWNSRLFMTDGYSALTGSPLEFFIAAIFLGSILLVFLTNAINYLILDILGAGLFLLICLAPLIVHSSLEDVRYWFIVGAAGGHLLVSRLLKKRSREGFPQRSTNRASYA